ncbi:MAG: aldose 1-epimerase family protein [Clostridia bacterium]|nr:aldose 1-epimerase family protein [Clostridia bacterium]
MNITLSKDDSSALCTTLGAELISFEKDGTEYCWYGIPEHWSGRAPVLFPIVCKALDGKIVVDGVEYQMPQHGLARNYEFTPVEVTPSKAVFELHENPEILEHYPFPFCLRVTQELFDDGFETTYHVTNTGSKDMTFCVGGHPGFNCPMHDGEKFEDYSIIFEDYGDAVMSITEWGTGMMKDDIPKLHLVNDNELPLRYSDYDWDALIIEDLPVRKLKLINRTTGHGIRFEFDRFDAIGIWTPIKKESPFLCFEPWCGLPGNRNETSELTKKKYARTLSPGESFETSYKLTVI